MEAPASIASRNKSWTPENRARFLQTLIETCNVTTALAAVGMHISGLYAVRRRDAAFRAEWDEALEFGYTRLETRALEHAIEGVPSVTTGKDGSDVTQRKFNPALAVALLKLYAEKVSRIRELRGNGTAGNTGEAMCAKLIKRLDTVAAGDKAQRLSLATERIATGIGNHADRRIAAAAARRAAKLSARKSGAPSRAHSGGISGDGPAA
jgi:hypothetical protein